MVKQLFQVRVYMLCKRLSWRIILTCSTQKQVWRLFYSTYYQTFTITRLRVGADE